MTDDNPCFLSVAEAAPLIAAKRISPVELTRAYLDRIERLNGTLHAYVRVLHDEALAAFHRLARTEGIIPALESSHALARAADLDAELVLVCLSGRGDKDLAEVLARSAS